MSADLQLAEILSRYGNIRNVRGDFPSYRLLHSPSWKILVLKQKQHSIFTLTRLLFYRRPSILY